MFIVNFELNNVEVVITCSPNDRLLDILRNQFALTGTKEGCGEGECGACSVIIDGKLVNSCLIAMGSLKGSKITTIEGLTGKKLYKQLARNFAKAGAVQCGFCTPGMILASYCLLMQNQSPKEEDIREAISGNLCRCTGYNMIVEAVLMAVEEGIDIC